MTTARAAKRLAKQQRQREALVRSCERWLKTRRGSLEGGIVIKATITLTPIDTPVGAVDAGAPTQPDPPKACH